MIRPSAASSRLPAPAPVLLALALALILVLAACGTDTDHHHPKKTYDVIMASGHAQHAVLMERATGVRFLLPIPPAGSGLVWEVVGNNVKILEQTSDFRVVGSGSGGVQVTFYSLKPGRSLVRFALLNPHVPETVPQDHYEAGVTVKADDD